MVTVGSFFVMTDFLLPGISTQGFEEQPRILSGAETDAD
jgi:hypothetical protein